VKKKDIQQHLHKTLHTHPSKSIIHQKMPLLLSSLLINPKQSTLFITLFLLSTSSYYILKTLHHLQQKKKQNYILLQRAIIKYAHKKHERAHVLPMLKSYLPSIEEQQRILSLNATQVIQEMRTKGNAKIVMATTLVRAIAAAERLECTAQEFFEQAMKKAIEADELFHKTKDPSKNLPLLHGLPVSVKDNIDIQGVDSTCGLLEFMDSPRPTTSLVAQVLLDNGAIIITKTNIPQGLMVPESSCRCFGTTKNPYQIQRTAGGSSGGEGALISVRGSFLGIGTDIGGSVRIPAHFCGIVGFKATPERMTRLGVSSARVSRMGGQQTIRSVVGPLARTVQDVILYQDLLWRDNSTITGKDVFLPPQISMDYQVLNAKTPLRIAFIRQASFFPTSQACSRAVDIAEQVLIAQGHESVQGFTLPDLGWESFSLYVKIISADGKMREFHDALGNEDLISTYKTSFKISSIPVWIRPLISKFLFTMGEKRSSMLLPVARPYSAYEHWKAVREVFQYRIRFIQAMQEQNIHAIVLPAGTLPAFQHTKSSDLLSSLTLTAVFNLLHFPAGTVPITRVQSHEEIYECPFNDRLTRFAQAVTKGSTGLPIGVQVAALPWKDEIVLRVMNSIDQSIQFCSKKENQPNEKEWMSWPVMEKLSVMG
jgi:fatty acid amide hydrolase